MTGQITLIFQHALQGAPLQARAGLHAGVLLGRRGSGTMIMLTNTPCLGRGGVSVPGGPLTLHRLGSGAGELRPGKCCTRHGLGLAGAPLGRRPLRWQLDTGSRALRVRGESRAKTVRCAPVHPAMEGNHFPGPLSL